MAALPEWKDMIAELVALPSVSSANAELDTSNKPVIDRLAEWLEELGFKCDIAPLPRQTHKFNLVATLGPAQYEGPASLALSGHSDTVPCDEHKWRSNPFELTGRDGRLYGLGSCDMKGFLALAVEAAKSLDRRKMREPLAIIATADEESGMDGARALLDQGTAPARIAVIGEPTGLKPVRAHKGILMEKVLVSGSAGHSSNPGLGVNAIEGMHAVMTALLALRDELAQRQTSADFSVNHATMNLGCLHGGDSANRIPASCELHLDLRFLPGMDLQGLREEIHAVAQQVLTDTDCGLECSPLFTGCQAFDTPADADIVRSAEEFTGKPACAVDFATEGAFYNQLGMQSIVMGPGHIEHAHQADEYLALDFIEPTVRVLRQLIDRYCL